MRAELKPMPVDCHPFQLELTGINPNTRSLHFVRLHTPSSSSRATVQQAVRKHHNHTAGKHCTTRLTGTGISIQHYHDSNVLLLVAGVKQWIRAVQRPQHGVQQQLVFGQTLPRFTDEVNQLQPITLLLTLAPL